MKRLSIEVVKQAFLEQGCELLSKDYENNSSSLHYRCCCGEEAVTCFGRFKKGSRCKACSQDRANSKKRHDIAYVRACFEDRGCDLLSDSYKNNYTPLEYICCCGNRSSIRLFSLLNGQRCERCDGCRGSGHYNWNPDRGKVSENLVFRRRQGLLVRSTFESLGQKKQQKSAQILGYTSKELQSHIKNHPNWKSVCGGVWHIDHVFPIKAFLDFGIDDPRIINDLSNLQPLTEIDNMKKNGKYDKSDFLAWLKNKGIDLTA